MYSNHVLKAMLELSKCEGAGAPADLTRIEKLYNLTFIVAK